MFLLIQSDCTCSNFDLLHSELSWLLCTFTLLNLLPKNAIGDDFFLPYADVKSEATMCPTAC